MPRHKFQSSFPIHIRDIYIKVLCRNPSRLQYFSALIINTNARFSMKNLYKYIHELPMWNHFCSVN